MLDKNGNRMLAYVQKVDSIEPIEGADNIELAKVLGWTLIVLKGEFKEGDKCVFFEIDSQLPSDNPSYAFLAPKKFRVKTYKLNKFGVISQGLILPLDKLGLENDLEVLTDLTDRLGVKLAYAEKPMPSQSKEQREKNYMNDHKRFFGNPIVKRLMKYGFWRRLFLRNALKKKVEANKFPSQYVSKTDEERIQNMPFILESKEHWVATEKIDGTSTTFLLVRKPMGRFEFFVCSRNLRLSKDDGRVYNGQTNIYWEMAVKYDVEKKLKEYLKAHRHLKWVCIQGESYGEGWQDNRLGIEGRDFTVFNFKDSEKGRYDSIKGKAIVSGMGMKWVPIIAEGIILTDFGSVQGVLEYATGKSLVNPNVLREGIVFRSLDSDSSFKAVSPEYLMHWKL